MTNTVLQVFYNGIWNTGKGHEEAREAIGRVSDPNTWQEGWADTERAIFSTRSIMLRADCMGQEDNHLLRKSLLAMAVF